MKSSDQKVTKIINSQRKIDKNISNFVVSNVSADGLALLGARASAGTVMIKYRSLIYWPGTWKANDIVYGMD